MLAFSILPPVSSRTPLSVKQFSSINNKVIELKIVNSLLTFKVTIRTLLCTHENHKKEKGCFGARQKLVGMTFFILRYS